jgi:hypothetical protein
MDMKPAIVRRPARWKLAAVACGLGLAAAGCHSGGSASPGATPGSAAPGSASAAPSASTDAALCADATALQASLEKLRHVKVTGGTAAITADINQVMANLNALINEAHGQYQAQTSALNSELATLRTAVGNLQAKPGASEVLAVAAAIAHVATTAQNLLSQVQSRCRSVSPSPTG